MEDWNLEQIFGNETQLNFPNFFSSKFFEKVTLLYKNEVWIPTLNTITAFQLT